MRPLKKIRFCRYLAERRVEGPSPGAPATLFTCRHRRFGTLHLLARRRLSFG
jgi:hypothetical protein